MNPQANVVSTGAFVVGPIGDRDAEDGDPARLAYEEGIQVFEEVIVPACTAFGLDAFRADMISRSGEIPEQVFRQLRDCPVVIADLTGANPNVMYELGLRHTTGRVTIQIGEKGRLPFDVAAIRTIMFKRTEAGLVQARKDLSKALAANLDTGGDPVAATRIWFEAPSVEARVPELSPSVVNEVIDEDDAPGFLELLAEMEAGIQSLGQTITAAGSIVECIGTVYTEANASVQHADAKGGFAGSRLIIAELTAKKLLNEAVRLEVVSGEFSHTVDRIEPGIQYLLDRLAAEPDQLASVPEFPQQIRKLCDAARSSIGGLNMMRSNTIEIGKASRSLKRAGERLLPSLKRFTDTSGRIADWSVQIDKIPEPLTNQETIAPGDSNA
ncbi:hypothetical protein [Nevskia ramosa]|uniref:hypothetical protein n=1 Tax=Nevskia ramosa TaxID=64002 RepID=UPI002353711C|nr:hypothetical protein [Nevskia ramosa]